MGIGIEVHLQVYFISPRVWLVWSRMVWVRLSCDHWVRLTCVSLSTMEENIRVQNTTSTEYVGVSGTSEYDGGPSLFSKHDHNTLRSEKHFLCYLW